MPAINQNADATTELQDKFIELQNYVDNYFENLDIQTEINNKLDEMAESGELAEIIAQYVELQSVKVYDTVNDMVTAENLVNGNIVQTMGFYELGDKGGAYYLVRTITSLDTPNNIDLFALNDITLVAELIRLNVNVKQYGAKGDHENDDTLAIQTCIDKNLIIHIPTGIYKVTNSINITNSNTKLLGEGSTNSFIIKYGTDTLDSVVSYNGVDFDYGDYPSIINLVFPEDNNISNVEIKNINLVANDSNDGIIAPHISYCNFYRVRTSDCYRGFYIGGWINKIDNCENMSNTDNGITIIDGTYNVIEKTHTNNITTSDSKGTYITNCAVDNGNPCFKMINSLSTFITGTSTETNRYVLLCRNSYVYINGCDLEGHSNQNLDLFSGYFQTDQNGECHVENSYIHFDDYGNHGNPTNKSLIYVNTGKTKLNDNRINIPYVYTTTLSGNGGTIEINDKVITSNRKEFNKTGQFSITSAVKQEVLRLPSANARNYLLFIKSYGETDKTGISLLGTMNFGKGENLNSQLNYNVVTNAATYNAFLTGEYDNVHNEIVLYYNETIGSGYKIYFEIEYTW